MKGRCRMQKDLRKSISLALALILLSGLFISVPANAEGALQVYDSGKMIYLYHDEDSYPGKIMIAQKYVLLEDTGNVDMNNFASLTGTVYYETGAERIPVFSYIGTPGDQENVMVMTPQFKYDDGTDCVGIDYGAKLYYAEDDWSGSCTTDSCYGLDPAFIAYLQDQGSDTGISAVVDFLKSGTSSCSIDYVLTDGNDNEAVCTMRDYAAAEWDYMGSYAYGYRLGYSRIEQMADFRSDSSYDGFKLYHGDLYVDADRTGALNGTLVLPNYNRTGCLALNSMYAGTDSIWSDGEAENTLAMGYNVRGIFPEPTASLEEAVEWYLQVGYQEYNPQDHSDEYVTSAAREYAQAQYDAMQYSCDASFRANDGGEVKWYELQVSSYNSSLSSFSKKNLTDVEADDEWGNYYSSVYLDSIGIPSIPLRQIEAGTGTKAEYLEYINQNLAYIAALREYFQCGAVTNDDYETLDIGSIPLFRAYFYQKAPSSYTEGSPTMSRLWEYSREGDDIIYYDERFYPG